jgi:hypothetical protein
MCTPTTVRTASSSTSPFAPAGGGFTSSPTTPTFRYLPASRRCIALARKRIEIDVDRLAATYGLDPETAVATLDNSDDYGHQKLILESDSR